MDAVKARELSLENDFKYVLNNITHACEGGRTSLCYECEHPEEAVLKLIELGYQASVLRGFMRYCYGNIYVKW